MVINQGDIFWLDVGEPSGSEPGYLCPHLIVQNDLVNQSRLNTVIVCALTSNPGWAGFPGNVLLDKGEANLPKQSVVNVTQILTVDKRDLREKIGALSRGRLAQVLTGIELVIKPREAREY